MGKTRDLLVLDNDGTLYDDSLAQPQFNRLLREYAGKLINDSSQDVIEVLEKLKTKWSTPIDVVALMREYGVTYADAIAATYLAIDLRTCQLMSPDKDRLRVLKNIATPKIVFTNNPQEYARKVLSYVGLLGCFESVLGIFDGSYTRKPEPLAYQVIERTHGHKRRIVFCDNSLDNLNVAKQRGWKTIWFNPSGIMEPGGEDHIMMRSFDELEAIVST